MTVFCEKKCIAILLLCTLPLFSPGCQTTIAPGAQLVTVYSGSVNVLYEGPTWDPVTQKLYFTTPNDAPYRIYRLDGTNQVTVWMDNAAAVNGTFLSHEGRLLTAEQQDRKIGSYRIGSSGPEDPQVLAQNSSWNQPNDICQTPNGHIYFTGPNWGGSYQAVYHLNPQGTVTTIITSMAKPNGIIASLDGTKLYISDSDNRYWRVFPVNADGSVGTGSIFFNPSTGNTNEPDGMTMDEYGNLYFAGKGGLWVVSPEGTQLDFVSIPEFCSNVTFGGSEGKTLYLTCRGKVYSLETTVRGWYWAGNNPTPTPGTGVLLGDVNESGSIDIVDALLIAQYYVGLNPSPFNPAAADVTGCDETIDIVDALVIARYYVGLISSFPCD
ncbi:MAG: SMP-30/gluconolactonase/LRE family protein [Spirochaetales bacterium]|nr:SMP-30/gluconolactonase/LRE family protein [Spirochaetales bacterium]